MRLTEWRRELIPKVRWCLFPPASVVRQYYEQENVVVFFLQLADAFPWSKPAWNYTAILSFGNKATTLTYSRLLLTSATTAVVETSTSSESQTHWFICIFHINRIHCLRPWRCIANTSPRWASITQQWRNGTTPWQNLQNSIKSYIFVL